MVVDSRDSTLFSCRVLLHVKITAVHSCDGAIVWIVVVRRTFHVTTSQRGESTGVASVVVNCAGKLCGPVSMGSP